MNKPMSSNFWREIEFRKLTDGRGDLIPIEHNDGIFEKPDIPFKVKRTYFISAPTNDDNAVRGKHAHYKLEQVLLCVHGSFTLDLEDENGSKQSFLLNKDNKGIYINNTGLVWRELRDFSPNCVVLVFASEHYDEKDYIRDYDRFRQEAENVNKEMIKESNKG